MPAIIVDEYTREGILAHPDWFYVFGDNLEERGFGGQAKACRGCPNAIGIATKRTPFVYLKDADYAEWSKKVGPAFVKIAQAMDEGKTIVWPRDGIGTGRARLESCAPAIWKELLIRISIVGGPTRKNPASGRWEWCAEELAE